MKIDALNPKPTNKIPFALSSFKEVPKDSGCYVLTRYDGFILYVGLSVNLSKRFLQHVDDRNKTSPTSNGKAIWFYYLQYDPTNLESLERTWLNQYEAIHGLKPILNKSNSPIY